MGRDLIAELIHRPPQVGTETHRAVVVFVLGNGWEVNSPQSIQVGRNGASISCIAAAAGRIWCGCQNHVVLVNASTLKIEVSRMQKLVIHFLIFPPKYSIYLLRCNNIGFNLLSFQ